MDSDILLLQLMKHFHMSTIAFIYLEGTNYVHIINGETEAEGGSVKLPQVTKLV